MEFTALTARQSASKPGPIMSEAALSALMWVEVFLCACFVALRTWFQYRNTKRFFVNDYFIFWAMLCHILAASVYQAAIPPMYELELVGLGLATPGADFESSADLFLRLQFAVDFLLWTTLWSVKFSLLFFFWRLFDSVRSSAKIFWWVMCAITASTWITSVVLQNFACDPISNFFTLGKCATKRDIYFSNLIFQFSAGTDIAGDIFILLIPFPLLRKLQIDARQKWILVGIFLLPLIPITFGIIRIVFCNPSSGNVNPIKFQLYSILENTAAIITACLPSLRLFVIHSRNGTRAGPSHYYGVSSAKHNRNHGTIRGAQDGAIPLETVTGTRNGEVFDAEPGSIAFSDNSQEEILDSKTPNNAVLVTREYTVTKY